MFQEAHQRGRADPSLLLFPQQLIRLCDETLRDAFRRGLKVERVPRRGVSHFTWGLYILVMIRHQPTMLKSGCDSECPFALGDAGVELFVWNVPVSQANAVASNRVGAISLHKDVKAGLSRRGFLSRAAAAARRARRTRKATTFCVASMRGKLA